MANVVGKKAPGARWQSRAPDHPRRLQLERPPSVETALKNRHQQFVIDGEAVVLGVDGIADFNALHSRRCDDEVQLYAFDILTLDGEDLRGLPLSMRKPNLARRGSDLGFGPPKILPDSSRARWWIAL